MNLFLDTNVLLGYTFETDHWNGKSLDVISHRYVKHSSVNVSTEFEHNSQTMIRKIKGMFNRFKREARLSKSKKEIESYLKIEDFEIKCILLDLIQKSGSSNINDIINYVNQYQVAFEKRCLLNVNYLKSIITFHNRKTAHTDIYDLCVLDGFVKEDPADVEIVIDAHDLGQKTNPLYFITGDYGHIVSRKEFIENITSIEKVIYLKHFDLTKVLKKRH
ncbi:MAG: hypothetical protein RBT65_02115 [Methanolobus sp.]|nr:hypothetical protein [Methanolobus sp.]